MVKKIISGGQTGADQAALQAAIDAGLEHSGWCPPGRVCESGRIPEHFHLTETPQECDPSAPDIPRSQRTIWNVRDSDASLIFWSGNVTDIQSDKGTKLGLDTAKNLGKPYLIVDPNEENLPDKIQHWIREYKIEVLSVGGPSEITYPGIYSLVYNHLVTFFTAIIRE